MPEGEAPAVQLRDIDTDSLEDVEDNREAVLFSVRLTRAVPEGWTHEFEQAYAQTPYMLKPPVQVDGDRLKVTFLPRYAGELDGFIHFLGLIVRHANDELRSTLELHTSNTHEQQKSEFRDALKRVTVPRA